MRRIGVLGVAERDPEGQARIAVFLQGLKQLGWTDGRNVRIDYRWGAKNSGEIKRNFGSTNRNISLMIGLASPYRCIGAHGYAAPKSTQTPAMVLVAKRREEDERFQC